MSQRVLTFVIFFFSLESFGDYLETKCFGPQNSQRKLIYLHGWDSPNISQHEKQNRKHMNKMATQEQWRIAVPRGNGRCNGGKRQCWKTRNLKEIKESWGRIIKSADKCFGNAKDFGVVGFSNGGYLVSALFKLCPQPQSKWYISIGAGENRAPGPPKNINCSPLAVLIGENDVTKGRAKEFYQKMKALKANVSFKTFPGGHIIHFKTLAATIKKFF